MLSEKQKQHLSDWMDKNIEECKGVENFLLVWSGGPREVIDLIIATGHAFNVKQFNDAANELEVNRDEAEKIVAGKLGMM